MKRLSFITLLLLSTVLTLFSQTYKYSFRSIPIAQALVQMMREHPELNVTFVYNDLEKYRINADVSADSPVDAIRQLVRHNPISVITADGNIFVEAMQKGKYIYRGRIVDDHGETVAFATVSLLAPRDSVVITFGTTDSDGRFQIPCDSRGVIAKLSGVGYRTTYLPCDSYNVGDVVMPVVTIDLSGLTIEAPQAVLYADRSIYTPSRRVKRVAMSAIQLLDMMSIPEIIVNGNSVTTLSGESVKIFINSLPASGADLSGMRMADVKRVEFLDSPADPRFHGATRVINFIVQEYLYGGYTKLMTSEKFLSGTYGKDGVFSRFSSRGVTYDLSVDANHESNKHAGSYIDATYKLLDGKGESYTVHRYENTEASRFRQYSYPVTLRATYSTKKFQTRNSLSYKFSSRPSDYQAGSLSYAPSLGSDYSYERFSNRHSNDVGYNGQFFVVMPNDFSLDLTPSLSYAHNVNSSYYASTLPSEIQRIAREDAYSLSVDLSLTKKLDNKNSLSLNLSGADNRNKINYSGTSEGYTNYRNRAFAGLLRYSYSTSRLSFWTQAGVACENQDMNGRRYCDVYPGFHLNFNYSMDTHNKLHLWLQYATFSSDAEYVNTDILQDNELMYSTGNPAIKNSRVNDATIDYTWIPSMVFSLGASLSNHFRWDPSLQVYEPYLGGTALLRTFVNNGRYQQSKFSLNAMLRLLDGRLRYTLVQGGERQQLTGIYHGTYYRYGIGSQLQWFCGDFYFTARYSSPTRQFRMENNTQRRERSSYGIGMGWGNGDLKLNISASNMFNRGWTRGWSKMETPNYSVQQTHFASTYHSAVTFTMTYTFGYGKKVKRDDENLTPQSTRSAILK